MFRKGGLAGSIPAQNTKELPLTDFQTDILECILPTVFLWCLRLCFFVLFLFVVELIRLIRLKAADRLLHESNKTVSEIAYEVGFSSPSYFAKCYKEQFNESPTDVQKRNKESQ